MVTTLNQVERIVKAADGEISVEALTDDDVILLQSILFDYEKEKCLRRSDVTVFESDRLTYN